MYGFIFWGNIQKEVSKKITLSVRSDDKPETNEEYQIQLINITTHGKAILQSQQEALIHKFKKLRLGTKSIYVYSS